LYNSSLKNMCYKFELGFIVYIFSFKLLMYICFRYWRGIFFLFFALLVHTSIGTDFKCITFRSEKMFSCIVLCST
jgi:hypothetical protein